MKGFVKCFLTFELKKAEENGIEGKGGIRTKYYNNTFRFHFPFFFVSLFLLFVVLFSVYLFVITFLEEGDVVAVVVVVVVVVVVSRTPERFMS